MSIILNHVIVPARNKHEAAVWFSNAFGLELSEPEGHFAGVCRSMNSHITFSLMRVLSVGAIMHFMSAMRSLTG